MIIIYTNFNHKTHALQFTICRYRQLEGIVFPSPSAACAAESLQGSPAGRRQRKGQRGPPAQRRGRKAVVWQSSKSKCSVWSMDRYERQLLSTCKRYPPRLQTPSPPHAGRTCEPTVPCCVFASIASAVTRSVHEIRVAHLGKGEHSVAACHGHDIGRSQHMGMGSIGCDQAWQSDPALLAEAILRGDAESCSLVGRQLHHVELLCYPSACDQTTTSIAV